MRILPFRRPVQPARFGLQPDWSQQELADFYRAHRLLSQNGAAIGMDRGQTDDGDPWLVFYDIATQDVFLHVARFDNQCMLVCDTLGLKLKRRDIGDVIVAFEEAVRQFVSTRQERPSNVLLHPAARVIMSISAVFLLFKLENSAAQAKPMHDPAAADAVRKQDLGTSQRLQQAFARIFDIADAPATAAAIAGAILSVEIARLHLDDARDAADITASAAAQSGDALSLLHAQGSHADNATTEAALLDPADHISADVAVAKTSADLSAQVQVAVDTKAQPAATASAPAPQGVEQPPEAAAPQPEAKPASDHHATAPASTASAGSTASAPVSVATDSGASTGTNAATTAAASTSTTTATQDTAASVSLAARAVQTLLDDASLASVALPAPVEAEAEATGDSVVATSLGDITIAGLAQLDGTVALFRETTLTGTLLTDTLIDVMARFGSYDVEFAEGRVLIEQHDASLLSSDAVGLWTNLMEDGSAISVLGHIDLVTDVTTSLA